MSVLHDGIVVFACPYERFLRIDVSFEQDGVSGDGEEFDKGSYHDDIVFDNILLSHSCKMLVVARGIHLMQRDI